MESQPFDGHFNYRSVIGKANYLEKSTRPEIAYALHHCAQFSADPKVEHDGAAVKWLGRYLRLPVTRGSSFDPRTNHFTAGLTLTLLGIGIRPIPVIQILQDQELATSFLMQDVQ